MKYYNKTKEQTYITAFYAYIAFIAVIVFLILINN